MEFTVILEIRRHGAACGSTRDVIAAPSAAEAERRAVEAWRPLQPTHTFVPLLTLQSR
jgi:hypothetical protein